MQPWTFVHVADMQPGSPKSFRFNPAFEENWQQARRQILELNPELLLVGGDLTRDGYCNRFELEEMKVQLDALPFPWYAVPGNMDTGNKHTRKPGHFRRGADQMDDIDLNVTSQQLATYAETVGPLWWSEDHKGVRFSGLADMVVNSGLPEEAALWAWAEAQTHRAPARHHVWIMHYALFAGRPDEPNWNLTDPAHYLDWYFTIDQPGRGRLLDLFKATGTELVITGHIHCRREAVAQGIRFQYAPGAAFGQWGKRWPDGDDHPGFLRYDVSDAGIRASFVPLTRLSAAADRAFGVGGHPRPEARVRPANRAWVRG